VCAFSRAAWLEAARRGYARGGIDRKMAANKNGWGGRRAGAGRPKGTGRSLTTKARVNRVVVMLDEDDYRMLERQARKTKLPLGTAAFQLMHKALKRVR